MKMLNTALKIVSEKSISYSITSEHDMLALIVLLIVNKLDLVVVSLCQV